MAHPFTNRLIKEKSPYLLQHAHNPVDWYPWGQEAFEAARAQDKPIFLSIGYATCHWCHVIDHESFQNPEIAKALNEAFINVKVDREERPEIDSIYMDFAQALMGSAAGWPLNVLLTPDQKPFFAVTYLPPASSKDMIGFPQFIHHIKMLWESDERKLLVDQAEQLVEAFAHTSNATGHELPSSELLKRSVEQFFEIADAVNGGLKGEPKFPLSYQSEWLLAFVKQKEESRALYYVELTLESMRRGGIYDHIGGGFHRYSVDEHWSIPHFEKMLYDNAILAKTYLMAWKYTKNEVYARVCRETLNYILRDMTGEEGGFYSGEDSDSEGKEGLYYTWTPAEVEAVIPGADGELFCSYYDISPTGNFEGRNVLNIELSLTEFSQIVKMDPKEVLQKLEKGCALLLKRREERPRPFKDKKVLTSWNGLVIDALARAGAALNEPKFTEAALKCAAFIQKNLWVNGRLFHEWCDKEARVLAFLDDYAYLIKGVLSLYEEGHGGAWLEWAVALNKNLERDFKEIEGAFYQTDGREMLVLRKCDFYDGAEPSGNAVHTENLLRLHQITQEEIFLKQAEDVLKASKNYIEMFSPGASYHLMALGRYFDKAASTATVDLDAQESLKPEIQKALASRYMPHASVIWKKSGAASTSFTVCSLNKCDAPLTKLDEIVKAMEKL
jgi:hypothetical protein